MGKKIASKTIDQFQSSSSKCFEKIIHNRLVNYLESKIILPDNQYGFRKSISGAMAIAEMCDKITAATDRNEFSVGVFVDLSEALDTIIIHYYCKN